MKIGQIVEKTGLTERTIRYYCEEGLVTPKTYEVAGRTYRDWSSEDVRRLEAVASLRRALFSIEEIQKMLASPDEMQTVLTGYHKRITAETEDRRDILHAINQIDFSGVDSVDTLAKLLESVSRRMQLPPRDVNPDFSRFDTESREEKEAEYAAYQEREATRYLWGKRIVNTIAVVHVILAILSAILSAFFGEFNLLSLIWQLLISVLLVMGISWVRYLFIVNGATTVLMCFLMFAHPERSVSFSDAPLLFVFVFLLFVNAVVSSLFLLRHEGVHDYLYEQKNG